MIDDLQVLRENLARANDEIARAAARSGRDPGEVQLLPVTKYVDAARIRLLYGLGVRDFAESRVQRGVAAAEELRDLEGVRWHLIGHLQRNKVRPALATFASIHSLDSVRLAQAVAQEARGAPPLEAYVEVNVAGEGKKTGAPESDLDAILEALRGASGVRVRGLMAMAPAASRAEEARPCFRRLRELRDDGMRRGLLPPGSGLSMGMSADFPVAVEEGATVVRLGSRLFAGLSASG